MPIAQSLLPEFEHEMKNTRKTLERLPEDKLDWKPHEKSWTFRELATHIAGLPGWGTITLKQDSFDMAPPGAEAPKPPKPASSKAEVLSQFDENVTACRAAIAAASDEHLLATWSFLKGGETIFAMPRLGVLRNFLMNHIIHHRAQFGIYLRLNDLPVPPLYGPSADEERM